MVTATIAKKDQHTRAPHTRVSNLTMYEWVATDKRNRKMKGEMASKNASLVKAELRRQGMKPQTVREKRKPLFGGAGRTIKPRDVAIFSRQIATMLKAGVPMVQSFE
ncbi:MAG TPA: type II secretion system F family protein, partial [Mizugakiibacter sp.]|nr:type II secretion system F family protein [Mizugakiibacter sp.]